MRIVYIANHVMLMMMLDYLTMMSLLFLMKSVGAILMTRKMQPKVSYSMMMMMMMMMMMRYW
jgi:hypothetical protein